MKKIQQQLAEWRKKSASELTSEIRHAEEELARLRINVSLQKEKKTSSIRVARKTIARLATIEQEKQHG